MNFYDCMQRENWRQLAPEAKAEVFTAIVPHFIHPKMTVSNARLVQFDMRGSRCETYEFLLDGEEFVFVPGREGTTLGWEEGLSGLRLSDVIQTELDKQGEELTRYRTNLSLNHLSDVEQAFVFEFEEAFEAYVMTLSKQVNQLMSPFRKADIPPLLVAKESQAVGTDIKGKYHIVSGEFFGDADFWQEYQGEIRERLRPPLDLSASLRWEYPRHFASLSHYYLAQSRDGESYYVYDHQGQTYGEIWLSLHRRGFQLLDEDSWEYCIGAGTRRLFRWGNEIALDTDHPFTSARGKPQLANMFGLNFSNHYHAYELTDRADCLKFEREARTDLAGLNALISQSSYYRSATHLSPNAPLDPLAYRYRKSIVIRRD